MTFATRFLRDSVVTRSIRRLVVRSALVASGFGVIVWNIGDPVHGLVVGAVLLLGLSALSVYSVWLAYRCCALAPEEGIGLHKRALWTYAITNTVAIGMFVVLGEQDPWFIGAAVLATYVTVPWGAAYCFGRV